jgi:hypothetical protein
VLAHGDLSEALREKQNVELENQNIYKREGVVDILEKRYDRYFNQN